jgi:hypothetical protein
MKYAYLSAVLGVLLGCSKAEKPQTPTFTDEEIHRLSSGTSGTIMHATPAKLYHEEFVVSISAVFLERSKAQEKSFGDIEIWFPGQQPMGKKYKVTVEELP